MVLSAYIAYIASMTEVTVSARIPRDLEEELESMMREERLEKSSALRKLLHLGMEHYRKDRGLRLLSEGKVTFSKAAEIAGLNVWEFSDLVKDRKISWVSDDVLADF